MCGIVGYIGEQMAVPILVDGLRKLEYRGYDSAGIAFYEDGQIILKRAVGKLSNLENVLNGRVYTSHVGIGHTRWATHGKPCEINAHPHGDCQGKIMVVHNGIIENYLSLKRMLISEGHVFRSETDTEVISHLIEKYSNGNLAPAVRRALREIKGTFAIGVISSDSPGMIVAARRGSPLIVGRGKREYFLASDVPAILRYTKDAIYVSDNEMVVLDGNGVEVTDIDDGCFKYKTIHQIPWSAEVAEKNGYPHFMLKEIHEQPQSVKNTYSGRFALDKEGVLWEEINLPQEQIRDISRIYIVSCGTSWHASLVGKHIIESLARIPVEVDLASEFRYRDAIMDKNTLTIGITQSGETADTLGAIRRAKECGSTVLVICNVVGSSATREADGVIYTHAGPEIGVASTKAFTSQLVALYLLAIYIGRVRGTVSHTMMCNMMDELGTIPTKIEDILKRERELEGIANLFWDRKGFLFLGRGVAYPIALEGALKLKEISYIHAQGYAAGEMKHGPIALVDRDMVVVCLVPDNRLREKMLGNIEEVRARDGIVVSIATEGDEEIRDKSDHVFYVPRTEEFLSPILFTVPLQLLAYHIAKKRGCDIDQPRNLAKSVTVE
ncbi:MAG: glutamine--fructose-6-phosphate transaminase (isomerizing) [Candidatus Dadabacteria bacterium]